MLSPNKTHQQTGKVIYFSPTESTVTSSTINDAAAEARHSTPITNNQLLHQKPVVVPWEEPLKHAIYLVLNNKVDGNLNTRFVKFLYHTLYLFFIGAYIFYMFFYKNENKLKDENYDDSYQILCFVYCLAAHI